MSPKWILAAPLILKGGAYVLLGIGSIANVMGHTDLATACLGIASVFGLGDTVKSAQNN